jgi:PAS domain S-box-containing protein
VGLHFQISGFAMIDQDKSTQQLIEELAETRQRVASLEQSLAQQRGVSDRLQETEALWRSIAAATPVFICLVDRTGTIQYLNRTFSGMAVEDAIGRSVYDILKPDYREVARNCIERVFQTGQPAFFEAVAAVLDDRSLWLETSVGPVTIGDTIVAAALIATDATAQKQVEVELARSKAMLQAAIDCLPFNFFAIGLDGRYMLQNAMSKAQQRADVLGKRPEDVCPNQHDLAIWLDNNRRAFAGEQVEGEVSLTLGGEERLYHNIIAPIRDGKNFHGILGVNIDITDQKRAEESLQKAHDELDQRVKERTAELAQANKDLDIFRKFAEDSGEGFGMSDFDGRILYVNPTLCRLFGEDKPEDVIGQHVSAYYPKEYVQRRKTELIPAILQEGHSRIEQTVLPRQGRPISTRQSTFLIRDEHGNPFRIAVVINDITERKLAEKALRLSEEKYRMLIDACPDAVVMADPQMRLVYASPQAVRLYGAASADEMHGLLLESFVVDEDRPRAVASGAQLLEHGIRRNSQYVFHRQDGSRFPCEVSSVVVRNDSNSPEAVISVVRDITDRKEAEAVLERERRTLKHLLHSSDHERQFIAYEIHDGLAQQLAAALMQFDAFDHLKQDRPKQAADAFHAAITMLRQAHYEARRLIAGVRPPILDESGVVEAISHLVHEQSHHIGPKIDFHSRVDFDRLDPTLENAVYRIAQEALNNACRHSKSDKISVSLLQRNDRLRIEVRDWGIGFNCKAVPKNHFGLEGIRQRARLLGGKCNIRSAAGKGTRISVELPVVLRDEDKP